MNDAMRDTFARQGYVVVPNVLNQQQLDELNEVYDQYIEEQEEMQSKGSTDKKIRFSIRGRDTHQTTDRHGNTYMVLEQSLPGPDRQRDYAAHLGRDSR